jgi:hypothetical protein
MQIDTQKSYLTLNQLHDTVPNAAYRATYYARFLGASRNQNLNDVIHHEHSKLNNLTRITY